MIGERPCGPDRVRDPVLHKQLCSRSMITGVVYLISKKTIIPFS